MKLIHVVPHLSEEASGPSYAIPRLCESLVDCGNQVELTCLAAKGRVQGVDLEVYPQWPIFKRFAISSTLASALGRKAAEGGIVHNHSLWSMVNVASGWVVPGRRARLVTSPHGTLSPWALNRSRWVKRCLWPLQRRALAKADMLHATSQEEYAQIRAQGFTAPVVVVPNGIDLPPQAGPKPPSATRTLLFLSRIHPVKGIDRLLWAWKALEDQHPDWQLVIAGRGEEAHVRDVRQLAASLGVKRVQFPGPLYGADKSRAYAEADLFILPTHSENFGMVVSEALAHGCPAIVSRGAPWEGLEKEGCGWWISHDVTTLSKTLEVALGLPPEQLAAMGQKGRAWMARDFSWASVGQRMDAAYRWLVEGGDRPEWVKVE